MGTGRSVAADLRDSVYDFRNPETSARGREIIVNYWASLGIPDESAALARAAGVEAADEIEATKDGADRGC